MDECDYCTRVGSLCKCGAWMLCSVCACAELPAISIGPARDNISSGMRK